MLKSRNSATFQIKFFPYFYCYFQKRPKIGNLTFLTIPLLFSYIFPEISKIFSWSFLYFFQKYAEILTNYRRKILRKLEKNYEIPKKEISKGLRKLLGNFILNFWKVCRKSARFQNKFGEHLKVKALKL